MNRKPFLSSLSDLGLLSFAYAFHEYELLTQSLRDVVSDMVDIIVAPGSEPDEVASALETLKESLRGRN